MTLKSLFIFTQIAIGSLALLNSCSKKGDGYYDGCENKTENYALTTKQKSQIPYTGNDTIRLISNLGDTIRCISKGVQSFSTRDFIKHSNPACGPNGTEKLYEANRFMFTDSIKNSSIELINYSYYPDGPYRANETITISFKDKKFFFLAFHISNSASYSYIGDLEIRGNNYLDVNKDEFPSGDSTCFVLLNKANGIIKIQVNTNERWELLGD